MTVVEASENLLAYFVEKENFLMSKNFHDIIKISDQIELDTATLYLALDLLEQSKVVSRTVIKINDKEEYLYVLNQPLYQLEQTINLPGSLCFRLSWCLSRFLDEDGNMPNPLKISKDE